MKAILVNDDKSLRWDEVPTAVCGEDDCLVKIEAAGAARTLPKSSSISATQTSLSLAVSKTGQAK